MLFHSYTFLFWFLPATLAGYFLASRTIRPTILLVASYIFYAWAGIGFAILMFASTLINFSAGHTIHRSQSDRNRGLILTLAILANLLVLGFFKYYGLFSWTLASLAGSPLLPLLHVALPIGISFYTFEGMSYVIDIYRRDSEPAKSLRDFAWFISFFPHLIAGPIIRYKDLAPQIHRPDMSWDRGAEGAYRFLIGLSKKVLLADMLATVADSIFLRGPGSGAEAWVGLLAYSGQIYFDFSGYTDMAIGLALLFGIRLPENFSFPYFAANITDFWRRWHITLSQWFRSYLYIPLGGNKKGLIRTCLNLTIVMALVGFWHGAAWMFLAWGLYHGLLLVSERLLGRFHPLMLLPRVLQPLGTFFLVALGWVLFRSANFDRALSYWKMLMTPTTQLSPTIALISVAIGFLFVLLEPQIPLAPKRYPMVWTSAAVAVFILCVVVIVGNTASPFIYFQF